MKGNHDKSSLAKTIERPEREMGKISFQHRSTRQSGTGGVRRPVEWDLQLRENCAQSSLPWNIINRFPF